MPINRYYTVTQEREVKVAANSIIDAGRIADAKFENNTQFFYDGEVVGEVRSAVRVLDLRISEDL